MKHNSKWCRDVNCDCCLPSGMTRKQTKQAVNREYRRRQKMELTRQMQRDFLDL